MSKGLIHKAKNSIAEAFSEVDIDIYNLKEEIRQYIHKYQDEHEGVISEEIKYLNNVFVRLQDIRNRL